MAARRSLRKPRRRRARGSTPGCWHTAALGLRPGPPQRAQRDPNGCWTLAKRLRWRYLRRRPEMAVAAGPALRPLSPRHSELTGRARPPWEASAPGMPPHGPREGDLGFGSPQMRVWVGAGLPRRSAVNRRQSKTKRGAAEEKKKKKRGRNGSRGFRSCFKLP